MDALFFVAGFLSAVAIEWVKAWLDRRQALDIRREDRVDRHREFQRETLLALSESLSDLSHATVDVFSYRTSAERALERSAAGGRLPAEMHAAVQKANARVLQNEVRVEDEETRTLCREYRFAAMSMTSLDTAVTSGALIEAVQKYQPLHDRIGVLIRGLTAPP
jgi:hypothetical protein